MNQAVIFDCDGVLVDSESLSVIALQGMLADLGAPMGELEVYDRFLGTSVSYEVEWLRDNRGIDLIPHLDGYRARLAQAFRDGLRPIPGIADALARIGPCRRAVASSSQPERLRLTLGLTGLWDGFAPHVYSASMVAHGKPAPDLFLLAAARLGASPADCVVIEDSPAGIHAARAAGMRVIGFLGGSHAGPARLAEKLAALAPDALVEHAADLPETLARMARSETR